MARSTSAILTLLALLLSLQAAASAFKDDQAGARKVVVEQEAIKVYPRFNKSLKPVAEVVPGQALLILKELKSWKQVQVEGTDISGWIYAEVKDKSEKIGKKFDTIAAPATTGLVARGWARKYASSNKADFSKVEDIMNRIVDLGRFTLFLQGEGK